MCVCLYIYTRVWEKGGFRGTDASRTASFPRENCRGTKESQLSPETRAAALWTTKDGPKIGQRVRVVLSTRLKNDCALVEKLFIGSKLFIGRRRKKLI